MKQLYKILIQTKLWTHVLTCAAVLIVTVSPALAVPTTFQFEGQMNNSDLNFDAGDPFMGSFTFESTTPGINHPDSSLNFQYLDTTAAWNVLFPNKGYAFTGTVLNIAVGNDTTFGDRYIVSLFSPSSIGAPFPTGQTLSFMQFDIFDTLSGGADFLSDDSIQTTPPNINLAQLSGGRLLLNPGNDQPRFTVTSLSAPMPNPAAVPEPSTMLLFGSGLAGLAAWRCRKTKQQ